MNANDDKPAIDGDVSNVVLAVAGSDSLRRPYCVLAHITMTKTWGLTAVLKDSSA